MSGMNPHELHLMAALGYDDYHVATIDSRAIYNLTWNCLKWEPTGYLSLTSKRVSINRALIRQVQDQVDEVKLAIRKAQYSSKINFAKMKKN